MSWLQVGVDCPNSDVDRLSDGLQSLGALSVTVLNAGAAPVLEPGPGQTPLWRHNSLQALFELDADIAGLRSWLAGQLDAPHAATISVDFVDDQDWLNSWRSHAVECCFGDRLWVVPRDALIADLKPQHCVLRLDPGLAFGTGGHPTTRMCLDWLARADLTGKRVLDFGCGSGILAIAAALLGAREVVAVDHDSQAVIATRANAAYNQLQDRVQALLPAAAEDTGVFDVVLANILANPLVELAPSLSGHTALGGTLVLAGLLTNQADGVMAAYPSVAFADADADRDQDWIRLVGRKQIS